MSPWRAVSIQFTGFVSNEVKMALYELASVVVLPSFVRAEAFGVTLLEGAMKCKPLITANPDTGTSFVNIDGVTGLVAEPGDSDSLREAMTVLYNDQALAHEYGKNARQRYQEKFRGSDMRENYADTYRRVIEAHR